jgi:hypothetical protein
MRHDPQHRTAVTQPISGKTNAGSVEWLPAERFGQAPVDAQLRAWLIGKGLLSLRMKAVCGERFAPLLMQELFLPAMGRV